MLWRSTNDFSFSLPVQWNISFLLQLSLLWIFNVSKWTESYHCASALQLSIHLLTSRLSSQNMTLTILLCKYNSFNYHFISKMYARQKPSLTWIDETVLSQLEMSLLLRLLMSIPCASLYFHLLSSNWINIHFLLLIPRCLSEMI